MPMCVRKFASNVFQLNDLANAYIDILNLPATLECHVQGCSNHVVSQIHAIEVSSNVLEREQTDDGIRQALDTSVHMHVCMSRVVGNNACGSSFECICILRLMCTCNCVCVCVCVCVRACVRACMCVHVSVFVCVCLVCGVMLVQAHMYMCM